METVQNTPEKKLKGKHMTSKKPGSKLMNCNPIPNLGPVSQNPGNVLGSKSNIQIKIYRI